MAHEISSAVFLNNQPAWHGLGQLISGTLPAHEAFQRAGALFPVERIRLWAGDPHSERFQASLHSILHSTTSPEAKQAAIAEALSEQLLSIDDTRIGIWRPDEGRILGTAGPDYQVIPNHRLLQFADAIREEVDMDSVIVLRHGAKVAFCARIRGTERQVVPGDRVYRNIVGYLGHDGSTAFGGLFSDIRVVCANTLGFAINDATRHGRHFTVRHTDSDVAQIDRILAGIDIARQQFDQVVDDYRSLREIPMSTELYRHWLAQVYQLPSVTDHNGDQRPGRIEDRPRKWALLEQAWSHGIGRDIPGVAGTAYWGLNCVTEIESSQRTKGAGKRRLHSALFGHGASVIRRAGQLARTLNG